LSVRSSVRHEPRAGVIKSALSALLGAYVDTAALVAPTHSTINRDVQERGSKKYKKGCKGRRTLVLASQYAVNTNQPSGHCHERVD
jgi:hypothetical protein